MRPQSPSGASRPTWASSAAVSWSACTSVSGGRRAREVRLDLLALVGVDRVERVRAEELVELGGAQLSAHGPPLPARPLETSDWRSRPSPDRIRLLTVPSASPSSCATSR